METVEGGVERWVKCVMRKFAYVGGRLSTESIVNSCEWACCILVVRFNCIKSEYVFVIDVPQLIFLKCRIYRLAFYVGLGLEY